MFVSSKGYITRRHDDIVSTLIILNQQGMNVLLTSMSNELDVKGICGMHGNFLESQ